MDHPHRHRAGSVSSRYIKMRFAKRFLRALRKINKQRLISNSNMNLNSKASSREIIKRYRRVRMAADASMASAVGPRRAWSRAILMKLRSRRRSHGVVKHASNIVGEDVRDSGRRVDDRKVDGHDDDKADQDQSQTDELRRLVPGGEAMDLFSLLDETAHYIKCLTTQIMMMTTMMMKRKKEGIKFEEEAKGKMHIYDAVMNEEMGMGRM
ncbi:Transcription factor IBH1-like protein [Drosera capensis]